MLEVEFPKIETLFNRDKSTFKVIDGEWRLPEFALVRDTAWIFQEKVDGTNIRIGWDGTNVAFGGRTSRAQLPADLVQYLTTTFTVDRMRQAFVDSNDVTLFGEGYGPGIQKVGKLYRGDKSFILFDVKVGEWWLEMSDVREVAINLGVEYVPIYQSTTLPAMLSYVCNSMLKSIVAYRNTQQEVVAEGIVLRTEPTLLRRNGQRLIGKIKCCDYMEGRR